MSNHYYYCHEPFNINRGGVTGYSSRMKLAFENCKEANLIKGLFPQKNKRKYHEPHLQSSNVFHKIYRKLFRINSDLYSRKTWSVETLPIEIINQIDFSTIKSIHIQNPYNYYPVVNTMKNHGVNPIKMLMSHNPIPTHMEEYHHFLSKVYKGDYLEKIYKYHIKRDEIAFKNSDIWFFPNPSSVSTYRKNWEFFDQICDQKDIRFIMTGSIEPEVKSSEEEFRKKYKLKKTDFLITYIGNKIPVKGFDIIVDVAKKILSLKGSEDIKFLIVGGKNDNSINDPRWIEVGHSDDPGSFFQYADAFLMFNRKSYFDLVYIEALSKGCPIFISNTPENGCYMEKDKSQGIIAIDLKNINGIVQSIMDFKSVGKIKIKEIKKKNRDIYLNKYSLEKFSNRYMKTLNDIYKDYNIKI